MIVIDEIGYAERLVDQERFGKETMSEMILVARYLRCVKKLSDDQIVRMLQAMLSKSNVQYFKKRREWNLRVEQALAASSKREPFDVREIPIFDSEMSAIATLQDKNLEKLMFGILVYSKNRYLKTGKEFISLDLKELFQTCRIPCYKGERSGFINRLIQCGMLFYKCGANFIVSPTITNFENNGRIVANITDSRELGYQYRKLRYFDDSYSKCIRCGKLIKQNANHTRSYCSECSKMKFGNGTLLGEVINDVK